jgi:hypothetical protein
MVCVSVALLGKLNWVVYFGLAQRSFRARGTVIQLFPKMHGTVRYSYEAGGKMYEGQTQPTSPNPGIEHLTPGAKVTVYYDLKKPEKSVLGSPAELLKNETITIGLVVLLGPAIILLAWRFGILRLSMQNSWT